MSDGAESTLSRLTAALDGRYRVERELGAGGMATVYLAHDIRHDRDVAIKVLHPDLAASLGGERFLTEIKTTARLQHPHILPLLESGEAGGLLYYVMPYVTGETLRARLERERQLPLEDALRITREIADALGSAHALGIIHRDIKPENILLREQHALVADFGIALAVQSAGGSRMTATGLSLGTPQYMSPEQAMGEKAIDGRTDIYALGAVTYEMLTGEPPFTGATVQAIVAKVLSEKPAPPSAVRETVSAAVDHAVLRALAKTPADRWPTVAAYADALRGGEHSAPIAAARAARPAAAGSGGRSVRELVHACVTVAAIGVAVWLWMHRGSASAEVNVARFVADAGATEQYSTNASQPVAISPDGRTIAYVGRSAVRGIWVRSLDQLGPRFLVGTRSATTPFFSADGKWIAYFTSGTVLYPGKLMKIPVDGGTPVEIADNLYGVGGVWAADGSIILGTQDKTGGLSMLPPGARKPVRVVDEHIKGDIGIHRWPRLLEDGKTVLFTSWNASPATARIGVTSLATHKTKILDIVGAVPITVLDGRLLYMQSTGTVVAVAFDEKNWTTSGDPVVVLEETSIDALGGIKLAINSKGDLVYARGSDASRVVLVDEVGKVTPLFDKPGVYADPRFSPDGRRVLLDVAAPNSDIWVFDRNTATLDRLTTNGFSDRPEWTPDGKRVFFRVSTGGHASLFSASASGGGSMDSLFAFGEDVHEGSMSPDGRTLVFRTASSGGGRDVWYTTLGSTEPPKPVMKTPFMEMQPQLSRDGKWLAYTSDESGTLEVYVRPFPGDGSRVRISTDGGTEPRWTPEGDRLYYRNDRSVFVAHLQVGSSITVTRRAVAFEGEYVSAAPHANYDVGPHGKELVMIAPASGNGTQLVMVSGWIREFRARFATGAGTR